MMFSGLPPAASIALRMWPNRLATWPSRSGGRLRVLGSTPLITLVIMILPIRLAFGIGFEWENPGKLTLCRCAIFVVPPCCADLGVGWLFDQGGVAGQGRAAHVAHLVRVEAAGAVHRRAVVP